MDDTELAAKLREQEQRLVFDAFDDHEAFALGMAIRERAIAQKLSLVCEVRTWERLLFYFSLPGTGASNIEWVRRKVFTVKLLGKSSYRAGIDNKRDRILRPDWGQDPMNYALHGGAFPIRVKSAGLIGAVTVSGLHEHDDHEEVVRAICGRLGVDYAQMALPPRAA